MRSDQRPEFVEATSPQQHRALAHPMRQRLLIALGERPSTVSRLATELSTNKGNVAHHVKVLLDAGLVDPHGTRTVRGGTERYYGRSSHRVVVPSAGSSASAAALVSAVAVAVADDDDPMVYLRGVRLTATQAAAVRDALIEVLDRLVDDPDGDARYGVFASVYRAGERAGRGGRGAIARRRSETWGVPDPEQSTAEHRPSP